MLCDTGISTGEVSLIVELLLSGEDRTRAGFRLVVGDMDADERLEAGELLNEWP